MSNKDSDNNSKDKMKEVDGRKVLKGILLGDPEFTLVKPEDKKYGNDVIEIAYTPKGGW